MATVSTESQHNISGNWTGPFWSTTDTGDVRAELVMATNHKLSGKIHFTEPIGAYEANLVGVVDDGLITATLQNFSSTNVTGLPKAASFKAKVTASVIEGEWTTSDGSKGKVLLRRSFVAVQAAVPQASPPATFLYKGTARKPPIPSCLLSASDLRKLYKLLEQKAMEAAELQVASLTIQPGQTEEQFNKLKKGVRDALVPPIVRLRMANGDWLGGTTPDPLSDEKLPDGISQVEFDSAAMYQATFKTAPSNSFVILLDFTRPDILDMSAQPAANASIANINATDSNWAKALADELQNFFGQTPTRRGWLHTARSYDILLVLLGFPLSFYTVYYLDRLVRHRVVLPEALAVAMYVWLVLVVFFFFRILFNYARWSFPKMEVDAPRQHRRAVAHRMAVSALTMTVLGALVKAALKLLFGIG